MRRLPMRVIVAEVARLMYEYSTGECRAKSCMRGRRDLKASPASEVWTA
jgi:hypothetical protein